MLRIAVWHDPPAGGARRAMHEYLTRLGARHDLDIYHLDDDPDPATAEGVAGRRIAVGSHRPRRHRRLAVYWNDWLTYRDLLDLDRLEERAAASIDAGGYDVALVSVRRSCQAPGLLHYLRTPSLFFMHEPPLRRLYEPWCRPTAAPLSPYQRARYAWRWPTRAALDRVIHRRDVARGRRATRVLANSRYTAGRIRAVYGREALVNYYGVDAARFRPAATPAAPGRVISAGALEPHKGFDFVIRALGRIPAGRRPALTLLGLAGHPRLPEHLRATAREAGVELDLRQGVGREGRGDDDGLVAAYQSSAAFVFGSHFEPIPLVIGEAMACGLPVVAVAEGGVVEQVREGETGFLVPRDESAFAAALDRLLADEPTRRALGAAARATALTWSWDESARRLEAILAETAALGRAARPAGRAA